MRVFGMTHVNPECHGPQMRATQTDAGRAVEGRSQFFFCKSGVHDTLGGPHLRAMTESLGGPQSRAVTRWV